MLLNRQVSLRTHSFVWHISTYSIDVGVWVLGLAVLGQDTWGDLVDLADKLEHWVFWELALGELALGDVTWVGLPQHGVAVTWNDLAGLEGGPEVLLDLLVREVVADGGLHLLEPVKDLLVGKTVERTGKTVKTGGQGEHWGGEGRADQVGGVGGDVATLVVGVDGQVETHELDEVGVLGETELVGKVVTVVLVLLNSWNLAVLEDVAVDASGDGWELGNEVHGVLEGVLPVLGLLHTLGVGLGEGRLVLESGDGEGELGHWVEVAWAAVDELLNEFWDIGAGGPLGREVADLLLRWNLTGKEEPEETYRHYQPQISVHESWGCLPSGRGSSPPGAFGRSCWHSGIYGWSVIVFAIETCMYTHGLATETDTLLRVEDGALLTCKQPYQ